MNRTASCTAVWTGVLLLALSSLVVGEEVDFATEIRPILAEHCFTCHGPDDDDGGLQLSVAESVFGELPSGRRAVVPEDPQASELLRRVEHADPDKRMPPNNREPLSDREIELLERWIASGADWDDSHWAFADLEERAVPEVEEVQWVQNPIDHFVLSELEARGIEPSPRAGRRTLIRRLYLDLLGLPPTPEQVEAFVEDDAPGAWERLVDDVLASPHFGERWGRHWLDMARYADSDGYLNDDHRMDAWRYRDWVIEAINDDMPFDEFTTLQLAGDLVEGAGPEEHLATAFHRQTMSRDHAVVDPERYRVREVFDRVETTSQVWLGLTANCARCHDHKYDQFTQDEYFKLFAFFNNAEHTRTEVPGTAGQFAEYALAREAHEQRLASLRQQKRQRREVLADDAKLADWADHTRRLLREQEAGYGDAPVHIIRKAVHTDVALDQQDDGSIFAREDQPERDQYTLDLHTEREDIVGFRLEALPDASLPAEGPGLGEDGGFAITEFRVFYKAGDDVSGGDRLRFASAEPVGAEDERWPAAAAIDGDNASTGWGHGGGLAGETLEAIFLLEEPLPVDGLTSLRVVMDQQFGEGMSMGRFRLTYVTAPEVPELSEPAQQALLKQDPAEWSGSEREELLAAHREADDDFRELERRLAELEDDAPSPPSVNARVLTERDEPRETYVLDLGNYEAPLNQVYPDVLDAMHPLPEANGDGRLTRLDLAEWLMDEANSLTPRVTVNHIWMRLFGEGIVRTPDNFGVRGAMPTHPELLDWLAHQYREQGWSRKAMIRLIVASETYRQQSAVRTDMTDIDPENELLYRQNRFRVEGEIVRDLSLAASGLLSPRIGGRSVYPPMPANPVARDFDWPADTGEQRYRRGMYTFLKRTSLHPNLTVLDCPDTTESVVRRSRSNTPLQALTTLNNEVYTEAAQAMSRRLLESDTGTSDVERLQHGFQIAIARPAEEHELAELKRLLDDTRDVYEQDPEAAAELVGDFVTPKAEVTEQAAWMVVSSTLLNLDEFLMRE